MTQHVTRSKIAFVSESADKNTVNELTKLFPESEIIVRSTIGEAASHAREEQISLIVMNAGEPFHPKPGTEVSGWEQAEKLQAELAEMNIPHMPPIALLRGASHLNATTAARFPTFTYSDLFDPHFGSNDARAQLREIAGLGR